MQLLKPKQISHIPRKWVLSFLLFEPFFLAIIIHQKDRAKRGDHVHLIRCSSGQAGHPKIAENNVALGTVTTKTTLT